MSRWILPALASALVAIGGCASTGPIGSAPGISVTDLTALPEGPAAPALTLKPLDSIEVRVLQDDAFDGTYVLDDAGTIDFPFIGPVKAGSRTPAELGASLARSLDTRYVINPQVVVRPLNVIEPSISVGGDVQKPGNIPYVGGQTLLRAVNAAGGQTEFAKLSEVLVFRKVAGSSYIGVYDLGAIERGNYRDPSLRAGDIVMVGDSPARRRFAALLAAMPLLATSVVLIDRLGN